MGCKFKIKIARSLSCNTDLNKKALCMKRSWDEVAKLLDCVHCGGCSKKCNKK